MIAFTALFSDGRKLVIRNLNEYNDEVIEGSEGASQPFFSYDGSWVGFVVGEKLKKVSTNGGRPIDIYEAGFGVAGAVWTEDNTIIYGTESGGLKEISAEGGDPNNLTDPGETGSYRWPALLSDGRSVVFVKWPGIGNSLSSVEISKLAYYSHGSQETIDLPYLGTNPQIIKDRSSSMGHLIFTKLEGLIGVPYDFTKMESIGSPVPIPYESRIYIGGKAEFKVSPSGSIIYIEQQKEYNILRQLQYVEMDGSSTNITDIKNAFSYVRISPDQKKLVLLITDRNDLRQVWTYNIEFGSFTQITSKEDHVGPQWFEGSSKLLYLTIIAGKTNNVWENADGSGTENRFHSKIEGANSLSWSYDGKYLAYYLIFPGTLRDIKVLDIENDTIHDLIATNANERNPVFAPTKNWVAYVSNETGQDEIFIQPFPLTGLKFQISEGEGRQPVWSPDGKTLYFIQGNNMISIDIQLSPDFRKGTPKVMFPLDNFYNSYFNTSSYDIHPDGDKFIMVSNTAEESGQSLNEIRIVLYFSEELKRLAPVKKE